MTSKQSVPDIDFLMSCIEHGEIKIDFAAVNTKYGWTNRQASQLKYKSILAAHGLTVTGSERYTKPTATGLSSAPKAKTSLKRKTEGKDAGAKKSVKKAKVEDEAEEVVDDGQASEPKTKRKEKVKIETPTEDEDRE